MKVLLAIDESKYSDAATQALMAQFSPKETEVRILHVIESLPAQYAGGEWGYVVDWQRLTQDQREQAEALMTAAAKTLRDAGFKLTTAIQDGNARSIIVDTAAKWPADLIVLGSHGRQGLDRFLLGSVSETVARHAPCSVLIVRLSKA
jgi:nucleotide-binding universal stress UspA family protein